METISDTRVARVLLVNGEDSPRLAPLFGQLVQYAERVIMSYRGDLFHDAEWLQQYVTREAVDAGDGCFEFYWAARFGGTHIGTDRHLVGYLVGAAHPVYRVRVLREGKYGNQWFAEFYR